MKKLLWLFPVLLLGSCNPGKDSNVEFKVAYKPDCVYNQIMNEKTRMESKYDASPAMLQTLKNKGIENPSKKENEMSVLVVLKTGKLGPQNTFPFTMEYLKTTSKDGKKEIPDSTMFYGTDTIGKVPRIDSMTTPGEVNDFLKSSLISSVQNMLQESCGPEKTLKPGEQFTSEAPMNMNMGGIKLQMIITTTYKLKSIDAATATFDISQVYSLNSTISDHTFKAEGEGKGKLVYDLKDNYYRNYNVNMVLGLSMDIGGLYAEINTESNIDIQTTLVQN